MIPMNNNTAPVTLVSATTQLSEFPYAKHADGNINYPVVVNHYMTTAKMFGRNKVDVQANDTFVGAVGNNPSTQWYWNVYVAPMNGATSAGDLCSAIVRIEVLYYAVMQQRLNISTS